ncbi:MAG: hypothetical protein U0401_32505 [Anaerolineae bacterium]
MFPKAPTWARPPTDRCNSASEGYPADPAKYAEAVTCLADRYRG